MDAFGIGAAVKGVTEVYFLSARQSGRTYAMLESLRDGDRIVFLNEREARRVQRLAKELGRDVQCVVCPLPMEGGVGLLGEGTSQGRTIFDHSWIEAYYRACIEVAQKYIDHMQRELSGEGMAHVETRLAAREINKWRTP
jgi:hypothetical protein